YTRTGSPVLHLVTAHTLEAPKSERLSMADGREHLVHPCPHGPPARILDLNLDVALHTRCAVTSGLPDTARASHIPIDGYETQIKTLTLFDDRHRATRIGCLKRPHLESVLG